jgi:hypothetical protein
LSVTIDDRDPWLDDRVGVPWRQLDPRPSDSIGQSASQTSTAAIAACLVGVVDTCQRCSYSDLVRPGPPARERGLAASALVGRPPQQ